MLGQALHRFHDRPAAAPTSASPPARRQLEYAYYALRDHHVAGWHHERWPRPQPPAREHPTTWSARGRAGHDPHTVVSRNRRERHRRGRAILIDPVDRSTANPIMPATGEGMTGSLTQACRHGRAHRQLMSAPAPPTRPHITFMPARRPPPRPATLPITVNGTFRTRLLGDADSSSVAAAAPPGPAWWSRDERVEVAVEAVPAPFGRILADARLARVVPPRRSTSDGRAVSWAFALCGASKWALRIQAREPAPVVSRFVRRVRTASAAVVVQMVTRRGRADEQVEHLGRPARTLSWRCCCRRAGGGFRRGRARWIWERLPAVVPRLDDVADSTSRGVRP